MQKTGESTHLQNDLTAAPKLFPFRRISGRPFGKSAIQDGARVSDLCVLGTEAIAEKVDCLICKRLGGFFPTPKTSTRQMKFFGFLHTSGYGAYCVTFVLHPGPSIELQVVV